MLAPEIEPMRYFLLAIRDRDFDSPIHGCTELLRDALELELVVSWPTFRTDGEEEQAMVELTAKGRKTVEMGRG